MAQRDVDEASTKLVSAGGIDTVSGFVALKGKDGLRRVYAELMGDYDNPGARPEEALGYLLESMKPGWLYRILQVYWPDTESRRAFAEHVDRRMQPTQGNEALQILHEGLRLSLEPGEVPLSFRRRTFLEFVVLGSDAIDYWETLQDELAKNYRIELTHLDAGGIVALSRWLLNPDLEDLDRPTHMALPGEVASVSAEDYRDAVAPEGITFHVEHVEFPRGSAYPFTVEGGGLPGAKIRPWMNISSATFLGSMPVTYSITVRRESPEQAKAAIRTQRTLLGGLMDAAADKLGRRPTVADVARSNAMEDAEAALQMEIPLYKVAIVAAIYCPPEMSEYAEQARRQIEIRLRTCNIRPIRYWRSGHEFLQNLQLGGDPYPPNMKIPLLYTEEIKQLFPRLASPKLPGDDAIWIGSHLREGSDVYFSFKTGLTTSQPIPTSLTTILGAMGEGKTYLMRSILVQRLLMGRTVVSIDPEGENNSLCEELGGRVVPAGIPKDLDTCLMHPLQSTLPLADPEYPAQVLENAIFVLKLLHGEGAITPGIENLLGMAVMKIWKERPGPTSFADLLDTIGTMNALETGLVMPLIQPYAQGGIYSGFFDRPNTLLSPDFEPGKWINFDLSSMREGKTKDVMHVLLAMFLRDAVTIGRNPMDIFIDEGWVLLRVKAFRELVDELGRRARKRDVGVVVTTHLPSDFLDHKTSLNLATNSFIGRMDKEQAENYLSALGIPPETTSATADIISNLSPYTFMAVPAGYTTAPFRTRVIIPSIWLAMFDKFKRRAA